MTDAPTHRSTVSRRRGACAALHSPRALRRRTLRRSLGKTARSGRTARGVRRRSVGWGGGVRLVYMFRSSPRGLPYAPPAINTFEPFGGGSEWLKGERTGPGGSEWLKGERTGPLARISPRRPARRRQQRLRLAHGARAAACHGSCPSREPAVEGAGGELVKPLTELVKLGRRRLDGQAHNRLLSGRGQAQGKRRRRERADARLVGEVVREERLEADCDLFVLGPSEKPAPPRGLFAEPCTNSPS